MPDTQFSNTGKTSAKQKLKRKKEKKNVLKLSGKKMQKFASIKCSRTRPAKVRGN